ncbi:MAG: hypothetical protein ABI240_18255 [Sphingomonas sp.]
MPYTTNPAVAALRLAPISLLFLAGCGDPKVHAAQREARVVADVQALQGEAQRACLCERTRGAASKKACWSRFETAIAPKHADEGATMCAPTYTASGSWSENGTNRRVVTQYMALTSPAETVLCTPAEAKVAENALNAGYDNQAAMEKANRLVIGIAHGQSFAEVPGKPLCG